MSTTPERIVRDNVPWHGYGPVADGLQWALAAEYLQCMALHGPLFDDLPEGPVSYWRALDAVTDALMTAATDLQAGHTREACCCTRQRHNHPELAEVARRAGVDRWH